MSLATIIAALLRKGARSGDIIVPGHLSGAQRGRIADLIEPGRAIGTYRAWHRAPDGTLLWEDQFPNLITDAGAKFLLDALAASALTITSYLGLKGTGSAATGDTQASHAGWSEVGGTNAPAYSGTRKTISWSAATGSGGNPNRVKTAGGATYTFSFTSGGTVAGAFVNCNGSATQDNTTGTLFSAGDFTGGNKTVANGETLTVTYQVAM